MSLSSPARAALVRSYAPCSRDLIPGEFKRVPRDGPLVGLFIACPACRFVGAHLAEDVGAVEEPDPAAPDRPCLVSLAKPAPCYKCGKRIAIDGDFVIALEDSIE